MNLIATNRQNSPNPISSCRFSIACAIRTPSGVTTMATGMIAANAIQLT